MAKHFESIPPTKPAITTDKERKLSGEVEGEFAKGSEGCKLWRGIRRPVSPEFREWLVAEAENPEVRYLSLGLGI